MHANHTTTYRFLVLALCLLISAHGMADCVLTLDSCLSLAQQHNKKIQQAALNVSKAEEVKKHPWTAAHQASLFITSSQSLLKLMCIELVMPSNHLILCCSLIMDC